MPNLIDLSPVINEMQAVSDVLLRDEIRKCNLNIDDDKFHTAFSCYGVTNLLFHANIMEGNTNNTNIPEPAQKAIKYSAIFIFRAYTTFVYMRSNHLEKGLDKIDEESPLRPFRNFFRRGRQGEDTIAQHIRNSLSHGSFHLSNDIRTVTFEDRLSRWRASIQVSQFTDDLCEEIYRLYQAAFTCKKNLVG